MGLVGSSFLGSDDLFNSLRPCARTAPNDPLTPLEALENLLYDSCTFGMCGLARWQIRTRSARILLRIPKSGLLICGTLISL